LTVNAESAELLFHLEKHSSSKIWMFFHHVTGVKKDIDLSSLPSNWSKDFNFACCNDCGHLCKVGTMDSKSGKCSFDTQAGMLSHLKSSRHSTTVQLLFESINSISSVSGNKRKQSSIASWAMPAPGSIAALTPKEKVAHQQLMAVKFLAENMLPLSIVESPAFRILIESHNKFAKPMGVKKIKEILINLDAKMGATSIDKMKNLSICLTLDLWTSKANQNYTGVTAHFIDNDFKLHHRELGIFLHEGGTKSLELKSHSLIWLPVRLQSLPRFLQ
jgi:hypothetical protein